MSKVEFDCGKWLQEAEEFALPNWSALPSIPLYMDQVMMFTGEALSLFERDEKQSLLTNSMINNYVKSGVVDHPVHKKYSKEHLSKLMMVGLLKQVLSIQDIAVLFSAMKTRSSFIKTLRRRRAALCTRRQRACTRKVTQRPCVQRR